MKDMQVHEVGDLREGGKREGEMEEVSKERSRDSNDPLEVDIADEDSIFYSDFASLPDFTCISSSSSSSSSSALPTRSTSSSSASSAWAVHKAEHEEAGDMMEEYNGDGSLAPPPPANGMDVLEEIADMGILDDTDIWDPAALFTEEEENNYGDGLQVEEGNPNRYHQDQVLVPEEEREAQRQENPSEDLALVFLEWLKTNKESISPEDLRSIRLKRSTIECAARRLGGGKEGMKQLLILILAWVQRHHLQKRRNREEEMNGFQNQNQSQPQTFPVQVPVSISNGNPPVDSCFSPSWIHPTPYLIDPARAPAATGYPSMMGYMGAATPAGNFPPSSEYHMIDPNIGWSTQFSQYGTAYGTDPPSPPQTCVGFANNYASGQMFPSEPPSKMATSATKEARKKRMARQRRLFTHHHRHRHQNHHASRLAGDTTCTSTGQAGQSNWVLYPPSSAPMAFAAQSMISPDGTAVRHADGTAMQQRQIASDRRQGWKSEKNLRFLLQKVLKQSDVGNLGRIVLPKKEAEMHLPELDARDGIAIQMEDIGTSRVWNMRYRYWPNNKSRMYLLENTGDFVRSNGLQEGDFIVIYSDAKCSKYMIRGVKVRKPELKQETKGAVKAAKTPNSTSEGISPTSQQTG
ncbi:B3 domain-containing transcription factor ABI3-like [Aristolochia californica]|uniref:B3 domain-containing transcription factor ABI3-like n=1 Tax=Aristolochia californica TaxID=171875 RepID=UPI0035DB5408